MSKALVIVDVTQFFLSDAPKDFALSIARHIETSNYKCLAFAVFQNTSNSNFARSLNWTKSSSAEDASLPPELQKFANKDNVFKRDTYSAFSNTMLHDYLQDNNTREVKLCGIDTDACVLATAFNAFDLGYKVYVDFDLTYSTNQLESEARAIIEKSILPQNKKQKS